MMGNDIVFIKNDKLTGAALQCWNNNKLFRLLDDGVIYQDLWDTRCFHINKEQMKYWNNIHCKKCTHVIVDTNVYLLNKKIKYCNCI